MRRRPTAVIVCPLLPHPPVSGGQKRTLRILEAIERAGARPHLVTSEPVAAAAVEALLARGWAVEAVPSRGNVLHVRAGQHLVRRPSPRLPELARRVRALTEAGPAFVQLEHTQSGAYLVQGSRVPAVLSLHNVDSEVLTGLAAAERRGSRAWARAWNNAFAARTTEGRVVPRVSLVACVSAGDAASVERLGGQPVLAPNGVDDELFEIPAEPVAAQPAALFFGTLSYEPNRRGLMQFLRHGWPEVLRIVPEARLDVAGPGPDRTLAAELSAAQGIRVLGVVEDLRPALAAARAVVVPIWVGGGTRLKALEAMAAARPVAGTPFSVAGLGFLEGEHGLVGSTPVELARALATLLTDPELAGRLGLAGRRLAEGSRWERTLEELEHAYRGYAERASSR